jgi:outer membrane protein assembly factor BamB
MPDDLRPRHDQPERPGEIDALDRAISRITGEFPVGPDGGDLDPTLAETVRRVHALYRSPRPDPSFADRLWEDLMHRSASALTLPLPLRPGAGMNGHRLGRPLAAPAPRPRSAPVRWAAVHLATVVLLLLTLFFGYLAYRDSRPAAIPSLQETPAPVPTPTVSAPNGWPQFRGNAARTGNMPGPGPTGDPVQLWMVHPTGDVGHDEISDPPVIADGVMYIGTGRGFLALDARDGSELWRVQGYGGGPAIDGDGLIVRSETGQADGLSLARIRRSDGSLVWTAETGQQFVGWYPALADGIVYVPSGPNDLIALDPATGEVKWRTKLDSPASRSAAVANGVTYVGDQAGKLYAVETGSGDVLWTYQTDAATLGVPSVANGTVYVSSKDGPSNAYYAVDAATGTLKWRFVTPSGSGFFYAAVDDTTVYVPSIDGVLYALDAPTGALRWKFQTGAELWAMPAIVGDTLYQAGRDGFMYALDAASGKERWRFAIDGPSQMSPVVLDGIVYVTTETGSIYAIGGSESAVATGSPTTGNAAAATISAVSPTAQAPMPSPATSVGSPEAAAASAPVEFVRSITGEGDHRISQPGNIKLDPQGRLWVPNGDGRIFIFDRDGTFVEAWGSAGTGDGQFTFNTFGDVAFGRDGSIYVLDTGNHRIQKFDKNRKFVKAFGGSGTGDGQFLKPIALAVGLDGALLVADNDGNRIARFWPDGSWAGAIGTTGSGPGQFIRPIDVVVDDDGRIWVTEEGGGRVEVFDTDGTFLYAFGGKGSSPGQFNVPANLAVDANGHVFVSDATRVVITDERGTYLSEWGEKGSGEVQFSSSGGVELDGEDDIFVMDYDNNRVQVFRLLPPYASAAAATTAVATTVSTPNPTPIASPAAFVTAITGGTHPLNKPGDIAIDPQGNLWIADGANSRFQIFAPDGTFLEEWGTPGSGDGQFNLVEATGDGWGGIAFDADGNFYVADTGNFRSQKFDRNRQFLTSWGTNGTGDGQFLNPVALAATPDGTIYVADRARRNIQKFDANGTFLEKWGSSGTGPGQFNGVLLLSVDGQGNVWVADDGNNRIQIFDGDGNHLATWGSFGTGPGQFDVPADFAFDATGHVFICDTTRVQVFDRNGAFLGQWGSLGSGDGQLNGGGGMAIDGEGNLYVVDYFNNRVQKFKLLAPLGSA